MDKNLNIIFSTLYPKHLKEFINNSNYELYLIIYSKEKSGYIDNNIIFYKNNFETRLISFINNNDEREMKLFNGNVYQKIKINNKNKIKNINEYNIENIEL